MHIPDGMLDTRTWVACWAGGAGAAGYASSWVRRNTEPSRLVLMAVLAALVFALQMLNFPVAAGTSGHFGGGVLAALLLGPWPACLVMTAVLVVQAVFFGDGGLTALGANLLNMALVAPFVGWTLFRLADRWPGLRIPGAFAAAWAGAVASSLLVGVQLWASGRADLGPVTAALGGWHALIGVGEGLITAGLVAWLARVRPALLDPRPSEPSPTLVAGLGALAVLAAALSFLASGHPDGLEYVYHDLGLGASFPAWSALESPFPDYRVPGLPGDELGGVAAGLVGLALAGGLLYLLLRLLQGRRPR